MAKLTKYRDIVDRIDIDAFEDAIGFIPNLRKENNDIGQCPDLWGLHKHGDRTGKFAIERVKKVYNCWVCGGGSILSLVMHKMEIDEQAALDWLSQFAGEHKDDDEFADEIEQLLTQDERRRNPVLPWFNEAVIEEPAKNIAEQADWLQERGISAQVARKHKLGYEASRVRRSSKGDYQGPAIIFPHYWSGRLVGWQERWLDDSRPKYIPKYTNNSDFPRQLTLYNYENVLLSPDPIVVVESVPTVLFLESHGYPAVATFGSNVSPEQMAYLRRFQQGVILSGDADKPGEKFVNELAEYLERFIDVKVAPFVEDPEVGSGSDLGDLAVEPDLLHKTLDAAAYR